MEAAVKGKGGDGNLLVDPKTQGQPTLSLKKKKKVKKRGP